MQKELAFQSSVEELKTSVSSGKATVAAAVTDKGVQTAADATFATIAENIGKIQSISPGNYTAKLITFSQPVPSVNSSVYGRRMTSLRDTKRPTYVIMAMSGGMLSDSVRGTGVISAILQNNPSASLTAINTTLGLLSVYIYQPNLYIGTGYGNGNYNIDHYSNSRALQFGINNSDGAFIMPNYTENSGSTSYYMIALYE